MLNPKLCLLKLSNMLKATVSRRPSAKIKSPYMSDIIVNGE